MKRVMGKRSGWWLAATLVLLWHGQPPALSAAAAADADAVQSLQRDGVQVSFEARPLAGDELVEGGMAELRFSVRDAAGGTPLAGLRPGAWLDQSVSLAERDGRQLDCKARIGIYLKNVMGARPLLDLNSYYLLLLNQDPSISVIDPSVSVGGLTSTLSRIPLQSPGMDWLVGGADKRLYVSLPGSDAVAEIDSDSFALHAYLPAGRNPVRLALQPDGRYLWVGNNAREAADSGVTVIDTRTRQIVLSARTGLGHHEIAFSDDSRYAFVSNRDSGTLSLFDIAELRHLKDLQVGERPLSVAFSPLSQAIYVVDGKGGTLQVIDARSLQPRARIVARPGLGPLRFSPDGRFGLVLNSQEDSLLVIDAASDRVIHQLEVSAEPYQLTFTRAYAYVRGLASPRVSMINLASLGEGRQPIVQAFEAGPAAPKLAGALPLADSLAQVRDDAALFVVNPVDNTAYFYMEGMNAPMSGYLNRGHAARAALVVDRSLRETQPGVFSTQVRLPAAGSLDVAFMLNEPALTHCFAVEVRGDPLLALARSQPRIEFLPPREALLAGSVARVRFRLQRGEAGEALAGAADLRVRYFLAPSSRPREVSAREVEAGLYEAALELPQAGAYYLHLQSVELGLVGDDAYTSLRVAPAAQAEAVRPSGAARVIF